LVTPQYKVLFVHSNKYTNQVLLLFMDILLV